MRTEICDRPGAQPRPLRLRRLAVLRAQDRKGGSRGPTKKIVGLRWQLDPCILISYLIMLHDFLTRRLLLLLLLLLLPPSTQRSTGP